MVVQSMQSMGLQTCADLRTARWVYEADLQVRVFNPLISTCIGTGGRGGGGDRVKRVLVVDEGVALVVYTWRTPCKYLLFTTR